MKNLQNMKCEACDISATPLSQDEIESLMPELSEWHVIDCSGLQKLQRQFKTGNYNQSISFTNAIAQIAESENHHPLIILEYSTVTVEWWSHKIKGLHKNDFIMASKTNELFT